MSIDNLKTVFDRIIKRCEDKYELETFVESMDIMLDELADNDFFGTEQQCDPRGDFRDGEWSIESGVE